MHSLGTPVLSKVQATTPERPSAHPGHPPVAKQRFGLSCEDFLGWLEKGIQTNKGVGFREQG